MTKLRRIPPPLRFTAPPTFPTPAPTHVDARTLGLLIVAASMILGSVVLTVLLRLFRRFF